MRSLPPILTLLLGVIPLSAWAQPSSPAELVASLRTALHEKSFEKLNAITYTVGMSDADKQLAAFTQKTWFSDREIGDITLEPVPAGAQWTGIMNGKKYEPTYAPVGLIKVQYQGAGNGLDSFTSAYAIVGGHYLLVSVKSTDVAWTGPPDKPLTFTVTGWVRDKVQIKAEWNSSGVDQEQVFKGNSGGGMGQYWEWITVTSTADDTELTLSVSEDNKEIYHSRPLKGKGTIEYKKS
ncbi:MAG: hypothetical protein LV480_00235 [Methylacidiphilales bacterium]|nr:hypothetical protein [Candidatus Methylacidiphilales bacterium]